MVDPFKYRGLGLWLRSPSGGESRVLKSAVSKLATPRQPGTTHDH